MKLYKYRYGSKRDLESLKSDYFYAPHPSQLNDPFEGRFDESLFYTRFDELEKNYRQSTSSIKEAADVVFAKIRENVGIFSLSKTQIDELLWAYYADSHCGFCIEYDFEKLTALKQITASFDVDYKEYSPMGNIDPSNELNAAEILKDTSGTKSLSWEHEKEYRICVEPVGILNYDFRAVKAIYFGLRMPRFSKDLGENNKKLTKELVKVSQQQVMVALKGRGIKYYQIVLKPNSYKLDFQEVEDIYKNAQKYKDKVSVISKDLIDYNDYGYGIEKHYFDKVEEIISREPYFYKLNSIHISKEESIRSKEPVIFAGFFVENNLIQIKRYFTLRQIVEEHQSLHFEK
ncbi:DUF2971 domain-containing protein [Acinetobacter cumulans]|uniref:DUF2971 domain-containing protein n=1 Tax=Acinetobacter cumulans TaxID=2136182 RepID=A0A3A8FVZ2_9GAMM|nr:DUF2971 domain-containing protein [Acinetobacter cumulans]RKG50962.1 DUF2971 domain-containing protein [Acinetobacter cumulans]